MKAIIRGFMAQGILADQSGQDMIEYLILLAIMLGLSAIILNALVPHVRGKANSIQGAWSVTSP